MRTKPTACRPAVEPVERRQLPSGLIAALQAPARRPGPADVVALAERARPRPAADATARAAAATTPAGVYAGNGTLNTPDGTPAGPNAAIRFPAAPGLGSGTPTRAELARQAFVARFSGPMATLAPRFSDQSKILYLRGLGTAPRFFLHGDYTLAMVFPAGFDPKNPGGTYDPATNPNGTPPVTGFAFLDDKNNNSGATVGLDLSAEPTSFDAKGRPTRLTFTSDPNVYSGAFYVSQSSGVVTIKYGANTATATFRGRLYTSGLTSPLQNVDLYRQNSG